MFDKIELKTSDAFIEGATLVDKNDELDAFKTLSVKDAKRMRKGINALIVIDLTFLVILLFSRDLVNLAVLITLCLGTYVYGSRVKNMYSLAMGFNNNSDSYKLYRTEVSLNNKTYSVTNKKRYYYADISSKSSSHSENHVGIFKEYYKGDDDCFLYVLQDNEGNSVSFLSDKVLSTFDLENK